MLQHCYCPLRIHIPYTTPCVSVKRRGVLFPKTPGHTDTRTSRTNLKANPTHRLTRQTTRQPRNARVITNHTTHSIKLGGGDGLDLRGSGLLFCMFIRPSTTATYLFVLDRACHTGFLSYINSHRSPAGTPGLQGERRADRTPDGAVASCRMRRARGAGTGPGGTCTRAPPHRQTSCRKQLDHVSWKYEQKLTLARRRPNRELSVS